MLFNSFPPFLLLFQDEIPLPIFSLFIPLLSSQHLSSFLPSFLPSFLCLSLSFKLLGTNFEQILNSSNFLMQNVSTLLYFLPSPSRLLPFIHIGSSRESSLIKSQIILYKLYTFLNIKSRCSIRFCVKHLIAYFSYCFYIENYAKAKVTNAKR